jgi:hypothetical protein
LELTESNPAAPAAGKVRVFGRNVGGRMMAAFKGPSGLDSSLQPILSRNKVAWANPQGNGAVIAAVGLTMTATGTATAANVATTNLHQSMKRVNAQVTTAATTAVAGFRHAAAQWFLGASGRKFGGFHFVCRFGPATGAAANTTRRGFCGFSSIVTASTDVNPSTLANIIGVGCDSTDTTYQIMHKNGTATATKINTGIVKSAADVTEVYELAMFNPPGSSQVTFEFTNLTTDAVFRHTATTNLPASTTLLAPQLYYSVGGVSSVIGAALMSMYIETDY